MDKDKLSELWRPIREGKKPWRGVFGSQEKWSYSISYPRVSVSWRDLPEPPPSVLKIWREAIAERDKYSTTTPGKTHS